MTATAQSYDLRGRNANEIADSLERAILAGRFRPGAKLPTMRQLARTLAVSPVTVGAAFRLLRMRGLAAGDGRRGTIVNPRPQIEPTTWPEAPAGVLDLAIGNPDPALLPKTRDLLKLIEADSTPHLYGGASNHPDLLKIAAQTFKSDGIPFNHIAVTSGAHDGIERVLQAQLRVGDIVGVEDPGPFVTFDLVRTLGFRLKPIGIDAFGLLPAQLAQALDSGINALIFTPRAQNPTGAAIDEKRACELRRLLQRFPDVLLVENDPAALIAGVPPTSLVESRRVRWAVVRSVSKFLGPDLRLALISGDALSISRLEARQDLGPCWVSHILQRVVAAALKDRAISRIVRHASETYARRREAFVAALRRRGIETISRSGIYVWIPVREEGAVIQGLLNAGWAVRSGERFRIKAAPAIRVMTSRLPVEDSDRLASEIARYTSARSPVSAR